MVLTKVYYRGIFNSTKQQRTKNKQEVQRRASEIKNHLDDDEKVIR